MLASMTAGELAAWKAWYEIEPRGEERADFHTAWLMSLRAIDKDKQPIPTPKLVEMLRDLWRRYRPDEIAERKEQEKRETARKVARQFAAVGRDLKGRKGSGRGGKHRQTIGDGDT